MSSDEPPRARCKSMAHDVGESASLAGARRWWLFVLLLALLPSCARSSAPTMVFAAASLAEAMQEVADAYASSPAGASVAFNFAGSSELARQILAGAAASSMGQAYARGLQVCTPEDDRRFVVQRFVGQARGA